MLSQYCAAYRNFQMDYAWVITFPILLIIAVFIVAFCVPKARHFPIDMILLLVFVLSFSYLISMSCSAVVDSVDGPVVPIAVGATLALTLALTLYAFLCRGNFLAMIGIAIVCGMTALVVGITAIFTDIPALIYVYCSLAIVIFGIYLVIITKMIIGGDYPGFPMDSPILASLFLYMYIMRIFLYILAIVGVKR